MPSPVESSDLPVASEPSVADALSNEESPKSLHDKIINKESQAAIILR